MRRLIAALIRRLIRNQRLTEKMVATEARQDEPTREFWDRVTEVVNEALRRPDPADRAAYLREAWAGDPRLRREVESLLRFERAESGILAGPLLGERSATTESSNDDPKEAGSPNSLTLALGRKVGPYRIEKEIGSGGMGAVALAWDEDLERRVALKVIRRDRLSGEALHRFERERRVLARIEHPAITRIFESGYLDADGKGDAMPYFTMEHVDGRQIDTYCDRWQLSIRARLELVIEICEGLDETHRQLVVHRDLKPSNILVTAEGRPKVLDFGIAKELDPLAGPDATSFTRTGHQPMSLPWASPEQVRGLPIGVATDIYSMGLLTYSLLCGHPAYALEGDYLKDIRRICEEIPPAPSSRVGLIYDDWQRGDPQSLTPIEIAAARGTEPRALRHQLRGDLDAIVARALAKEPEKRYRSAREMATDLRCHLVGLPVNARAATLRYRLEKFIRRHRWRLAALLLVAVSLGVAVAARYDAHRQAEEQQRINDEAKAKVDQAMRQAEALTAFARSLVLSTDPDTSSNQPMTPQQILARGESEARQNLVGETEMLAHQLEALGLAHYGLRDIPQALHLFGESFRMRRSVYGVGDHPLTARSINNLAAAASRSGDRQRAECLYRLALTMKKRLDQPPDELARVENNLASILAFRGELDEAEKLYRSVLRVRRLDEDGDPRELASSLRRLGNLLYLDSRFKEAEPLLREALALRRQHDGQDSIRTAAVWSLLGRVFHAQGNLKKAEDALQRALSIRRTRLGDSHLHVALSRKDLASLLFQLNTPSGKEAESLWTEAMIVLRTKKSLGAWELADAASQEGERLVATGRIDEALPLLREGHRILQKVRGERSIYARRALARLCEVRRCRPEP